MNVKSRFVVVLALVAARLPVAASGESVPDTVFLQEVGRKIVTPEALRAAAVFDGNVYFGSEKGLLRLDNHQLRSVSALQVPVTRLVATNNALWAIGSPGLHRFQNGVWKKISNERVTDVTEHLGNVVVSFNRRLATVADEKLELLVDTRGPFPIDRVLSHCETLYVQGAGRLTLFDGVQIGGRNVYKWSSDEAWDWGALPSSGITDAVSQGSRLYLATTRGLGLLRGMSLTTIRGEHGLCHEDTTCLSQGFEDDLWIGTIRGAIRMVNGSFHYFAGQRWLPHDRVNAIAATTNAVYLATDKGLGIIEYEPYTLLKKAAFYERHLEEWGQKRLGFTHKLEWDKEHNEFVREISDNDGGYSGNYLAAQCYRFATTKDPTARAEAVKTFQALRWLRRMSGVSPDCQLVRFG